MLTNQGIHTIDMFQWLMGGEPEEVLGRWSNLTHPYIDVEDTAAAVIRFKGGVLGVLTGTTSARWSHSSIVIHGSQGHSVGVMEEPEGADRLQPRLDDPRRGRTVERSLAEHVERGEYMFRTDNSSWQRRRADLDVDDGVPVQAARRAELPVPADRRPRRVDPDRAGGRWSTGTRGGSRSRSSRRSTSRSGPASRCGFSP